MAASHTVVFTDLHGSTSIFESLGNARATEVVTRINDAIGSVVVSQHGRVVKTLGDGLLAIFDDPVKAMDAVIQVQDEHKVRLTELPPTQCMPLRVGVASGHVEWVNGDCYGDAVNVASRLCDLCGPNQIWVHDSTIDAVKSSTSYKVRALGAIEVRGRSEPCTVYQVDWQREDGSATDVLTVLGNLDPDYLNVQSETLGKSVCLEWGSKKSVFHAIDLPVTIGRVSSNRFVVSDPRVSRAHAQLIWKNGAIVLEDLSSYGTWIRFDGTSGGDALLRRSANVLYGSGQLVLGATFSDLDAPIVRFIVA